MKYHMKAESQCSMHCCAHGSSSDYDASIYENCTHRSTSTLDLTSLQQCQVIAPDLLPGDPNKCECCSGDMLLTSRKSNKILRCSLVSDCQQWMHESCLKTLTLGGRTTLVYGCRFHTEIYDRYQHPEECHSCNSIFELVDQCSKIVSFLETVVVRYSK